MTNWEQYRKDLRSAPLSQLIRIVISTHRSDDCGLALCYAYALQELDRREEILNREYPLREQGDR